MANQDLHKLFIDELADMYSSEHQIIESLPKLIKLASNKDLKDALTKHLKETENQAHRIKKIFTILKITAKEKKCQAMEGILKEADEIVKNKSSTVLDVAIISAGQKVEHYEIASYGTLVSFAKHLDLDSEVADLLQENLDEEANADKTLTKIADGSFFTSGINKEAATGEYSHSSKGRRDSASDVDHTDTKRKK